MTKLSDTQLVVLSAAARRPTLLALPLPPRLKGGAAHKVIKPLIAKGLLEEVDANVRRGDPVWRKTGDGHGVSLIITAAGLGGHRRRARGRTRKPKPGQTRNRQAPEAANGSSPRAPGIAATPSRPR